MLTSESGARTVRLALALAMVAAVGVVGCETPTTADLRLRVETTGGITGLVFRDENGSGALDSQDEPAEGLEVRLVLDPSGQVVATDTTDENGAYEIRRVPVGTYVLVPDSAVLADSLVAVDLDTTAVTLAADDSLRIDFGIAYPTVTIEEARSLPVGQRVFIEGWALNLRSSFGDTTVHVADTAWAIRTTRVARATIFPGDSVRFLGRTQRRNGQPTLDRVTPFILAVSELPPPVDVTTAGAASADEGRLDAQLVQAFDATVTDTMTVDDDYHFTVDDGSGPLLVVVKETTNIDTAPILPDSIVDELRGVLVPADDMSSWVLRPRFRSDIEMR